ncbi:MAG TPA: hypothetical protein VKV57_09455 [bacterium]|nr:hypothetical protein [bacterium]
MGEVWVREALAFGGAVVGASWGYFFGRAIERRVWMVQFEPGLEAMDRVMKTLGSSIDFIRNACEGIPSATRGSLAVQSSTSPGES